MERVFITGMGVRSAVGNGLDAFWRSLMGGRSGVGRFEGDAGRGLQPYAAAAADLDPAEMPSKLLANRTDRVTQLSLLAVGQALRQAESSPEGRVPERSGVYWGTGAGGAGSTESAYREYYGAAAPRIPPLTVVMSMVNAAAGQISIEHALRGPLLAFSNACASAGQAIGEALFALRAGRADLLVAGGADAILYPGWVRAWQALGVLAPPDGEVAHACKPFDARRAGLVLGEAAAALVLETEQHARRRGARPLAELVGYGVNADAQHLSKPDLGGQVRAMQAALGDGGLRPDAIGYVNAHGTATATGDPVEVASLQEVFGGAVPWTSSTKALHGHTMGASGALELVAGVLALQHREIPPQWHTEQPIAGARLALPGAAAWPSGADAVLSNSFAFGGCNVSLVVRAL
ncbi:beta-ketoacyl-[acyl-carrier-protein] synthase family protein [Methylibium sp.]|uniref:beta-ketoacyl-[acyl-carrier-protein] synthase family protein n=1 Tax=Methylibium sp. TaxID=2067992 RepID=UPI003D14EA2A